MRAWHGWAWVQPPAAALGWTPSARARRVEFDSAGGRQRRRPPRSSLGLAQKLVGLLDERLDAFGTVGTGQLAALRHEGGAAVLADDGPSPQLDQNLETAPTRGATLQEVST